MEEAIPFETFETVICQHLQARGLPAEIIEEGVNTGHQMFAVFRRKVSIASAGEEAHLALEVQAIGIHPVWGKIEESEMIVLSAPTPREALTLAAEQYVETTLTALLAFQSEAHATGFEEVQLDDGTQTYAHEGGIHLTTSPPHIRCSNENDKQVVENFFVNNPLIRFIPESLKKVVEYPGVAVLCLHVELGQDGVSASVLFSGEEVNSISEELAHNVAAACPTSTPFEANQVFVLQPKSVHDEEYWRIESKDPEGGGDYDTFATCSAGVKLEPFHYFFTDTFNLWLWGIFLSLWVLAIFFFSKMWIVTGTIVLVLALPVLYLGLIFFRTLSYKKEKFIHTLLTPGIIISVKPLRVLCSAPLAKSSFTPTRGEAFKILENPTLPVHRKKIGAKIPIASAFLGEDGDYWDSFDPEPICWASSKKEVIAEATAKLGVAEFERLQKHWESGEIPDQFRGIYKLDKPTPSPIPNSLS